ncbi:4-amino-4-deoxy-L-arabinose transferase [Candidatus Methylacidiphilum fumarolicum]|uniref:4-amino-4-deoxy-L-arabinose transferase or related glycosyltransferase of PMT family n=3 Tax=Candidatus Methylacidiphilum fumarolicum TaxID=591154 RepID=I0K011_METFB|nr:glycosyltransferase family 39 protein [Candidatus Methylacidiphilum fumarolicum]CCG92830.1 4-amino-4-deoxy-L-arabinose transferase or related glycosyltransferase of PMT family [Methylacidiphilum fumariolicum SolV]TFE65975.1 4-amino-4-deoxy-L-arabinose transferase [Candidatus Methylacidiphilum fumarolicum]TFE72744.1 4-amino-4-deoxy-L-arabinose transferase [Candidatus Methylacidiphilum fumarolicum]TFE73172.1 4-amino-4-deoxy-L-arabinose transferase [Candidatus Methylacidiphilum fumarolicum]
MWFFRFNKVNEEEIEQRTLPFLKLSAFPSFPLASVFFLLVLSFFYIEESRGPVIFDDNEGLYAGAAKEMIQRNDWILPTVNGVPRLQKPPLVYWSILISYKLFGINEFAARLPEGIATVLWIIGIYLLGSAMGGEKLGLLACLMLGSAFGFFIFTHILMPEPFFSAAVTYAILFIYLGIRDGRKRYFLAAWFVMALGSLAKGLHAVLYPLLSSGLSVLFFPKLRKRWLNLFWWPGIVLFFLMFVPWYVAIEYKVPGFLREHFLNEQFGHALNHRNPPDAGTVPILQFYLEHFIFLLPWTLYLGSLWELKDKPFFKWESSLLISWILTTFLSVTFSSLQDYYAMSCWGALIMILAKPFCLEQKETKNPIYFSLPSLLIVLIGLGGILVALFIDHSKGIHPIWAKPLEKRDTFLSAIFGFSFSTWKNFVPLLYRASFSFLIGGIIAYWLFLKKERFLAGIFLAFTMIYPLHQAGQGFGLLSDYFSSMKLAKKINHIITQDDIVISDSEPNFASGLFFYLNHSPIFWVHANPKAEFAQRSLHLGSEYYLTEKDVENYWNGKRKVFLITEEVSMPYWAERFKIDAAKLIPIEKSGTRVLLLNHRNE